VRVNKNCVRVYVRLFVCVCVCVYVCVWVWVCVWNKTDLYVYKSTYIHMCVYVHIHVCEYDVRFSPRAFSYVASATSISQSLSFSLQQQRRGISLFLCVSLLLARAPSGCQCWFGSPVPSAPYSKNVNALQMLIRSLCLSFSLLFSLLTAKAPSIDLLLLIL